MSHREHFPTFDPGTMPDIPASWQDVSWRNDACPSFATGNRVVFIDFAEPDLRCDGAGTPRFSVHTSPEIDNGNDVVFQSDDWPAVLLFLALEVQSAFMVQHMIENFGDVTEWPETTFWEPLESIRATLAKVKP